MVFFPQGTIQDPRGPVQFILAVLAQTAGMKGVIWWASHHRWHHKYSDTPKDTTRKVRQRGFWYFARRLGAERAPGPRLIPASVKDLTRFPELRFLDHENMAIVPMVVFALIFLLVGGVHSFIWGFFGLLGPGVARIVFHQLAGASARAAPLRDGRRLARPLHLGRSPRRARGGITTTTVTRARPGRGFRWWEIDVTYYVLWVLAHLGIIWDPAASAFEAMKTARETKGRATPLARVCLPAPRPHHVRAWRRWFPPSLAGGDRHHPGRLRRGQVSPIVGGILVLAFCATALADYTMGNIFVNRGANLASIQNEFLSSVSHEIRTPLTSILLFIETLRADRIESPAERQRCLAIVHQELTRLDGLVGKLIELSKIESRPTAGKEQHQVRLSDFVGDALTTFEAMKISGEAEVADVRADLDPDLLVYGDPVGAVGDERPPQQCLEVHPTHRQEDRGARPAPTAARRSRSS